MIRVLLAFLSVVAGACLGLTLASSCASPCGCTEDPPLLAGEFNVDAVHLSNGADEDLRDIKVTDVIVNETTLNVLYHRRGAPGMATYRATFKLVDGTVEVLDDVADAGLDGGAVL